MNSNDSDNVPADKSVLPAAVEGVPPVISETATSDPTGTEAAMPLGNNIPDGAHNTAAPGDAPSPQDRETLDEDEAANATVANREHGN